MYRIKIFYSKHQYYIIPIFIHLFIYIKYYSIYKNTILMCLKNIFNVVHLMFFFVHRCGE